MLSAEGEHARDEADEVVHLALDAAVLHLGDVREAVLAYEQLREESLGRLEVHGLVAVSYTHLTLPTILLV